MATASACDGSFPVSSDLRRRQALQAAVAALMGAGLTGAGHAAINPRRPLIKPARLKAGDTIGLVNPSHAIHEREPYELATETLTAMGFKVVEGAHLRDRRGHLAGTDADRAADLNAMFADPAVAGILALSGGSGANRILPLLDYGLVRANPKFLGGFSDITALLHALHARTGLVTFHAPVGVSTWNEFSLRHFRAVAVEGQALTMANPRDLAGLPAPRDDRIRTLRAGIARGPLLGGNLAVLSAMAGSSYLPDFDGAILFLEEINEYIYRVDRMLSTLKLAGVFERLAGVVIGQFTKCTPGEGFGTLTLDEVFDDWFLPLGVPVYRGAMIGHIARKFTVPLGVPAEIDASAGTIRLLEAAVR